MQDLSMIGLTIERNEIRQKIDMYVEKPEQLHKYIKRILESDWSNKKKIPYTKFFSSIVFSNYGITQSITKF